MSFDAYQRWLRRSSRRILWGKAVTICLFSSQATDVPPVDKLFLKDRRQYLEPQVAKCDMSFGVRYASIASDPPSVP